MKNFNDYCLNIIDLKDGLHTFNFDINDDLFKGFDRFEFFDSSFQSSLEVKKFSEIINCKLTIKGVFYDNCYRCNTLCNCSIDINNDFVINISKQEKYNNIDDSIENIYYLSSEEKYFDFSDIIRENISLNIPMRILHENKEECNQDTIKKLKEIEKNNIANSMRNDIWKDLNYMNN